MGWWSFVLFTYAVASLISLSCDARTGSEERAHRSRPTPAPFTLDDLPSALPPPPRADISAAVDLLRVTPSVVAVSSRSELPRDFPEHVLDGRPDTAWKTRQGDVVGAWIAFRLPEDAFVSHVMMSAGFERKTDVRDFFTEGPRIRAIRIYRNNRLLKDVALDPNVRAPQRIDIAAAGGDYRLMITDVLPGTTTALRELAVSRFAVIGSPGSTLRRRSAIPRVLTGHLGAAELLPATFALAPSPSAACTDFARYNDEALDEDRSSPWRDGFVPPPTRCGVADLSLASSSADAGDALEVNAVEVDADLVGPAGASFHGAFLGVRRADGFFRTDIRIRGEERSSTSRITYAFLKADVVHAGGHPVVAVQVVETRTSDDDDDDFLVAIRARGAVPTRVRATHLGSVCRVGARPSDLVCTTTRTEIVGNTSAPTAGLPLRVSDAGEVSFDLRPR